MFRRSCSWVAVVAAGADHDWHDVCQTFGDQQGAAAGESVAIYVLAGFCLYPDVWGTV
jgi:hypothetical protein